MNVQILAAGRSPRLRHVLRKDVARSNALDEHRAEITDQRRDEILWLERVSGSNCRRFLTKRAKHTANDFRLPVKIDESFFYESRQLQKR